MAAWHYHKDGQQYGPVSGQQLKQLAAAGNLRPDDLIRKEGMDDWVPAAKLKGLFPASAVTTKPPCPPAVSPSANSKAPAQATSPPLDSNHSAGRAKGQKLLIAGLSGIGVIAVLGLVLAQFIGGDEAGRSSSESGTTLANADAVPRSGRNASEQNGTRIGEGDQPEASQRVPTPHFSDVDYTYDFSDIDYSIPGVDYSKGPNGERIEIKEFRDGKPSKGVLGDIALPFVRQHGFHDSKGKWVPHGTTTHYLPDKETKTSEIQYYNGDRHGWARLFYEDGSNQVKAEQTYVHGNEQGLWRSYYPAGTKKAEYQKHDGMIHGRFRDWHPNGELSEEGTAVNDFKHGLFTTWYPNGTKKAELHFIEGERHGRERNWHDNGQLSLEQYWVHDQEQGPYAEWHDNGQQAKAGQMKDGEETGLWVGWYPSGEKSFATHWANGEKSGNEKRWSADGSDVIVITWGKGDGQPHTCGELLGRLATVSGVADFAMGVVGNPYYAQRSIIDKSEIHCSSHWVTSDHGGLTSRLGANDIELAQFLARCGEPTERIVDVELDNGNETLPAEIWTYRFSDGVVRMRVNLFLPPAEWKRTPTISFVGPEVFLK